MKKLKFKYIHIFNHNDLKFNLPLVEGINNEKNGFDTKEHAFVTPFPEVYEKMKAYSNVYYESNAVLPYQLVNKYGKLANWIIVHDIGSPIRMILVNPFLYHRIIWRTWGGDVLHKYKKGKMCENIVRYLVNCFWKFEVKQFCGVGCANIVDVLDIKSKFGDIQTYILNYTNDNPPKDRLSEDCIQKSDMNLNVLIGHAGTPRDNHLETIRRLEHLRTENIRFYFILSYGDPVYIKNIKLKAREILGDKAIFIDKFMLRDNYISFLNKMDIGIFDGVDSYALGNIEIFLNLKKKIYLNKNGVIAKAFSLKNIPFFATDDLTRINIDKLSSKVEYPENMNSSSLTGSLSFYDSWNKMLLLLNSPNSISTKNYTKYEEK